jgi:hypothetical protein
VGYGFFFKEFTDRVLKYLELFIHPGAFYGLHLSFPLSALFGLSDVSAGAARCLGLF